MPDPTAVPRAAAEGAAKVPKHAAKGLAGIFKGKPAWMWIAGFTVLAGVAFLTFRAKSDPALAEADQQDSLDEEATADYGPSAAGVLGGGYVMPSPTQGAFGGFDTPDMSGSTALPNGVDPGDTIINLYGPAAADDRSATTEAGPVTGGGMPRRPSTRSHRPPKKKPRRHTPARHKPSRAKHPKKKPRHAVTKHKAHPKHKAPAHHAPAHTPTRRRRKRR